MAMKENPEQDENGKSSEGRRRIVVKIGTNTLSGPNGGPDPGFLDQTAGELTRLMQDSTQVILVSSGAIGAGRRILGLKEPSQDIRMRQACAAVGQPHLMALWHTAFEKHGNNVAQVLVTAHTFERRRSYLNLKNTIETLLSLGIVPVVNENDTVSIEEIDASFGDNDRLSALVAAKTQAHALLLLSDVDALYTRPPGIPGAQRVPEVKEITPEIEAMAAMRPGSGQGRGGMRSKLTAARIAMDAGIEMHIVHGRTPGIIQQVLDGQDVGTRFAPREREEGRKHWLRHTRPHGRIHIDDGAREALVSGRHLLPAGVTRVEGAFEVESLVEIVHDGHIIAKALSGYSSEDLTRVKGRKSDDVHAELGTTGSANITRKGAIVLL
jgi:glutamate 5-kinase